MEQHSSHPKKFLTPESIVGYFGLESGDHVADFGTGHGFFAVLMSRLVGGNGKIYAIDVQKSALDILRSKAKEENLQNIEPLWADLEHPEGLKIKNSFMDFVLIANILFQAENKEALLDKAFHILRPGGKMAIIDWDMTAPPPLGPVMDSRIDKEELKKFLQKVGLKMLKEFPAGSHHYGLIFQKNKF